MGFIDRIKKVYQDSSGTAKNLVDKTSDQTKKVLNTLDDNFADSVFEAPDFLTKAVEKVSSSPDVTPGTKKLLNSLQLEESSAGFLSRAAEAGNLSEGTKKLLNSLGGEKEEKKEKFSVLGALGATIPGVNLVQILQRHPKAAGAAGDFLSSIGTFLAGKGEEIAQDYDQAKEEKEKEGGLSGPEELFQKWDSRGGGVRGVTGVVSTPFTALGEAIKGYGEGKIVEPTARAGLTYGSITPVGAAFNAVFAQPEVANAYQAKVQPLVDGLESLALTVPAVKSFTDSHPEAKALLHEGLNALPFILAFGVGSRALKGKAPKTPEELALQMKDPAWQESAGKFMKQVEKDIKKGDFTRVNKVLKSEDAVVVKEMMSGTTKEPVVKPNKSTGKKNDKQVAPIPEELFDSKRGMEVFEELQNSKRGERIVTEEGTTGISSSFPEWVPDDLRSRGVFNAVEKHLLEGTIPTKTKEVQVYNLVHEQILGGKVIEPVAVDPYRGSTMERVDVLNKVDKILSSRMSSAKGVEPPKSLKKLDVGVEMKKLILNEAKEFSKTAEFEKFRETVTLESLKKAAEDMDWDVSTLKRAAEASKENAAIIAKAQEMLMKASTVLRDKVNEFRVRASELTSIERDVLLDEIYLARQRHGEVYKSTRILEGSAGRTLKATQTNMRKLNLQDIDRKMTPEEVIHLAGEMDKMGANKALKDTYKSGWIDKMAEMRRMGLLSNPESWGVNVLSNLATKLWNVPVKALTAAIEVPASILGGRKREVFFREVLNDASSLPSGLYHGVVEGLKVLATGKDPLVKGESFQKHIGGIKGEVIRLPGRVLQAGDKFTERLWYASEIRNQALRQAKSEGLKGKELEARITELVGSPTPEVLERVKLFTDEQLMRSKLGKSMQAIAELKKSDNWAVKALGHTAFTFVQFPANAVKWAVNNSALNLLNPGFYKALKAGGEQRSMALSRMAVGTGISAYALLSAADGKIRGAGPSDKNKRDALYDSGWRPYTILINGKWVSYKRIFPLSFMLGVPATVYEQMEENSDADIQDKLMFLGVALAQGTMDMSPLTGLVNLISALDNPTVELESYVKSTAASLQPFSGTTRFLRNLNDPFLRLPETTWDYFKNQVPGLSNDLVVRRDRWGEPIDKSSTLPLTTSEEDPTPLEQELMDLEYYPGIPEGTYLGWEMNQEVYDEFQTQVGQLKKKIWTDILDGKVNLNTFMSDPPANYYPNIKDPIEKRKVWESAFREAHERVREKFGPALITEQLGLTGKVDPKMVDGIFQALRKNIYLFDKLPQEEKEEQLLQAIDRYQAAQ